MNDVDVAEIKRAYDERRRRVDPVRYSLLNPGNLRNVHERDAAFASALLGHGYRSLDELEILEIGCGTGGELVRLLGMGASMTNLYGVDLLPESLRTAEERLPGAHLSQGDAAHLGFPGQRFDIVVQFTALSSMRSPEMRLAVAREMTRVVRPGGLVVSYDFIRNPRNPDTVGIPRRELARLFPNLTMRVHRVTLAPPLARRLPARLAGIAAAIRPLRTHLMAIVEAPRQPGAAGSATPDR